MVHRVYRILLFDAAFSILSFPRSRVMCFIAKKGGGDDVIKEHVYELASFLNTIYNGPSGGFSNESRLLAFFISVHYVHIPTATVVHEFMALRI